MIISNSIYNNYHLQNNQLLEQSDSKLARTPSLNLDAKTNKLCKKLSVKLELISLMFLNKIGVFHIGCNYSMLNSNIKNKQENFQNITKSNRVVLGSWLMQLAYQLKIPKDAVYNAVYYTDIYIKMVDKTKLNYQGIGLCALFIASKLQLSNHPRINSFLQSMENSITKQQLIDLYQNMLLKLEFRLNPPNLYQQMTILVSLFNTFITQNKLREKQIKASSEIHSNLFWMLDCVHLNNQYKQFSKQKVCLSLMYIALKRQKTHRSTYARKMLVEQLQTLKSYGEIEVIFVNFLINTIKVVRKLFDLKQQIKQNAKWAKIELPITTGISTYQSQLDLLKQAVMHL